MLDFLVGNDFLLTIIAFVIVLISAVIIHEMGHFLAAKAIGITVLEFGIGFPPRIAKLFNWGETEFTLNWIPLGGFVRPLGEDMIRPISDEAVERDREKVVKTQSSDDESEADEFQSEREELEARGIYKTMSVNEAKPWPRIFFMAAGALANFISAFILFIIIALIGVPEAGGARVELVNIPENAALLEVGLQNGDVIERINGDMFNTSPEFFEHLNELSGQHVTLTVQRPRPNRETLTFDEIQVELTVAPDMIEPYVNASAYVLVNDVLEDSPADRSGLQVGDMIASFNGMPFADSSDAISQLQQWSEQYAGQEVAMTVLRDGELETLTITPRENPPPNSGRMGIIIQLAYSDTQESYVYADFGRQTTYVPKPIGQAIQYGADRTFEIMRLIAEFPSKLIRGETAPEERRPLSVVEVSRLGADALQESIESNRPIIILEYIALISIALGVTNLLPIPALDGGRILFVLIEIVRGRPISPEREGLVHLLGLIFLLFIGMIVIINDLVNPLSSSLP